MLTNHVAAPASGVERGFPRREDRRQPRERAPRGVVVEPAAGGAERQLERRVRRGPGHARELHANLADDPKTARAI